MEIPNATAVACPFYLNLNNWEKIRDELERFRKGRYYYLSGGDEP
jgi:hypothetical protein